MSMSNYDPAKIQKFLQAMREWSDETLSTFYNGCLEGDENGPLPPSLITLIETEIERRYKAGSIYWKPRK